MKGIVYSLFGYNRGRVENCFDFNSYLRGLMLNLRFNRLLYPEWQTILQTDKVTYAAFKGLFEPLEDLGIIITERNQDGAKLCEAMLWRLKPIYTGDTYTHLLCRDLDSIATYREVQAVQFWIDRETKAMHAITDSVSHDVPLLGGMIGMWPGGFRDRSVTRTYEELMEKCKIDLSAKGTDQHFLNDVVYPMFARKGTDSITQHYFNGHGNTFLSDWHTCACAPVMGHADNCPNNYKVELPEYLKETNSMAGHIGASGAYMPKVEKFIFEHRDKFADIIKIEGNFKNIFYWNV